MTWVDFFFDACKTISKKSKDPSTKIGCVITDNNNAILSTGFNGFPSKVNDDPELFSIRYDRPEKYIWTAHAEENAIAFAARNGVSLKGAVLYVSGMKPCTRCTRLIIQAGITTVNVMLDCDEETLERWKEDNSFSDLMFKEAGVLVNLYDRNRLKISF